jgi:hypothetical protein
MKKVFIQSALFHPEERFSSSFPFTIEGVDPSQILRKAKKKVCAEPGQIF